MNMSSTTVAVKKFRGWMTRVILVATGIVFLGIITCQLATHKKSPVKTATSAQSSVTSVPSSGVPIGEWMKLTLPPGGRSDLPTSPVGMHIEIMGREADLHTVYADGHESVISVESDGSNPAGQVTKEYVTNKKNEENTLFFKLSR